MKISALLLKCIYLGECNIVCKRSVLLALRPMEAEIGQAAWYQSWQKKSCGFSYSKTVQ